MLACVRTIPTILLSKKGDLVPSMGQNIKCHYLFVLLQSLLPFTMTTDLFCQCLWFCLTLNITKPNGVHWPHISGTKWGIGGCGECSQNMLQVRVISASFADYFMVWMVGLLFQCNKFAHVCYFLTDDNYRLILFMFDHHLHLSIHYSWTQQYTEHNEGGS